MLLHENTVWVGTDRCILRFSSQTFKPLDSFDAHNRVIHNLISVGNRIWSGSSDQTIKIWDPNTTSCLQTIEGHHTRIFSLCTDGSCVWSAGWDKTVMLWNAKVRIKV
jgi:WD40 repeat protein